MCLHTMHSLLSADLPDPPATELVNVAVAIFAIAYPLQTPKVQEGTLEQLAAFMSSPILQRDPGRKAAITINVATTLLATLKVAVGETKADKGDIKSQTVEKVMEEILRVSPSDIVYCIKPLTFHSLSC